MGQRLRALTISVVLVGVGVLLGSSLVQWWPLVPVKVEEPSQLEVTGRVRVEVLNAGGTDGVARDATAALRDMGLDVVYWGNAENFSEGPSVVLDRMGRSEAARAVAGVLGISNIVVAPDSNLFVDVTVRLGSDWSPASEEAGEVDQGEVWWDPRRFFHQADTAGNQAGGG